jgi:hypothetical protein
VQFEPRDFPNLHAGNHQVKGAADKSYNCIAWAIGRTDANWDPKEGDDPEVRYFWPPNTPSDYQVTSLILALESVGFVICADGSMEAGFEKVAIYADGPEYMHAARQLENGKWTSKMGKAERIEHDAPEGLAGPRYGQVTTFMKRNRPEKS